MMNEKTSPLLMFRKNIHSQNGEDGICAELLKRLKLNRPGWVCEFGAWDGKHLSNTFALVENGWKAVFIEGDDEKYNDLIETAANYENIVPVKKYVEKRGGLDSILAETDIVKDFDVLSIDIDSYDLEIWEPLSNYNPTIVIIEINSSIPPGEYHRHSLSRSGNSFTSTLEVAKQKGYVLVCHTGNLIFVREDRYEELGLPKEVKMYPEKLFLENWLQKNSNSFMKFIKRMVRA